MYTVTGYNENFHNGGWRKFGRLIINFSHGRVTSVFYNCEQIL